MAYEVSRHQAQRLNASLRAIREETERYLGKMRGLLGEALIEEGGAADVAACLSDLISDHLTDELADVTQAVEEHYDVEPMRFREEA